MDIQYISKIIPLLMKNHSEAHAHMLSHYVHSPVHYVMDRDVQNDLIQKGKDLNIEHWFLPHEQFSIGLNRYMSIGSRRILIKDVYLGTLDTLVPTVSETSKLIIADLANKLVWLQHNMTHIGQIYDSAGVFREVVDQEINRAMSDQNVLFERWTNNRLSSEDNWVDRLAEQIMNGSDPLREHVEGSDMLARSIAKHIGNDVINRAIIQLQSGTENVRAFCFFVTFVSEDGTHGHMYSWENNGTLHPLIKKVNCEYFNDGFNCILYDAIYGLLKGLSQSWQDRLVIEKPASMTKGFRKHVKRLKKSGWSGRLRLRTLEYDLESRAFSSTKAASNGPATEGQWKQSPHERSATHAFVWVTEANVGETEIVYDEGVHPKSGNVRKKVLRPRKGCKINGGQKKVVQGRIKSVG